MFNKLLKGFTFLWINILCIYIRIQVWSMFYDRTLWAAFKDQVIQYIKFLFFFSYFLRYKIRGLVNNV